VGLARTNAGTGYWIAAASATVYPLGSATAQPFTAGDTLSAPVVGIVDDPYSTGYWLYTANGEIACYGAAPFLGSLAELPLNEPIVGMAAGPWRGATAWLQPTVASSPSGPVRTWAPIARHRS